jgi:hypothetical protein
MASERPLLVASMTLAIVLAGSAAHAQAQPRGQSTQSAADRETARSLMDEGRSRQQKGDLKGALAAYNGADAIMHVPTTGLAVARTQAALGLLVEARDTALGVTRIPAVPNEPAVIAEGRRAADALANELAPRIPTLTISVKAGPGVTPEIAVDDVSVPYAALVAPRRVNPGHHVVVAKVGSVERRAEIDLVEKDAKSVALELPADAKATAPVAVVPVASPPADPVEPKKSGTSPLVYVGVVVGSLGLLTGLGTGYLSLSKVSSADEQCVDKRCPPAAHADLDSATTMAMISNVGFIVAGAGAATALVGILMSGSRSEPLPATAHASPYVGPGQVGVTGSF